MSDLVGRTILGFRIVAKIKDGGMSTVFKGLDSKEQVHALKMINEESFAVPEMRTALKREAELTRSLVHPHIIRVTGYYEAQPRPFILEEFFESENLKWVLYNDAERVNGKIYRLMRQMAEALQFANSKGIVHRDVKPENILVHANGDGRLIDFSIAQTKWERIFSFGGKTKGTPLYMSPEQISGRRLDPRSDQYSLGVVLFEMLAKRPPFSGMSSTQILDKHLVATAPSLRSVDQGISPEIDEMVAKLLAKDPKERFEDLTPVIIQLRKSEKREEEIREREEIGRKRRGADAAAAAAAGAAPGRPSSAIRPLPAPAGGSAHPAVSRTPTSSGRLRTLPGSAGGSGSEERPAPRTTPRPTASELKAAATPAAEGAASPSPAPAPAAAATPRSPASSDRHRALPAAGSPVPAVTPRSPASSDRHRALPKAGAAAPAAGPGAAKPIEAAAEAPAAGVRQATRRVLVVPPGAAPIKTPSGGGTPTDTSGRAPDAPAEDRGS
ncbi:MAG: protein kinase [Planctomycetes bacterium]|nr:protein kinase [Planctomycetota bacterium]